MEMTLNIDENTLGMLGRVAHFIHSHPQDGMIKLEILLNDDKLIWDKAKVLEVTGWSEEKLQKLRATGKISYIPDTPTGYLPWKLKEDLERMLVGGLTGRKPRRRKKAKA